MPPAAGVCVLNLQKHCAGKKEHSERLEINSCKNTLENKCSIQSVYIHHLFVFGPMLRVCPMRNL